MYKIPCFAAAASAASRYSLGFLHSSATSSHSLEYGKNDSATLAGYVNDDSATLAGYVNDDSATLAGYVNDEFDDFDDLKWYVNLTIISINVTTQRMT
jgi:hypothetical protein